MVANRALEAAKNGDIDTLQSLDGPSLEADKHGATCLHYAARGGSVKTIEFLVKKKGFGAIQKSNVGATPAHDAAATGNLAAFKWILENTECKVDDQDGTGATALHLAARYGHTHVVDWLLYDTNCDIMKKTATGAMPLHFAVVGGKIEIVKLLVKESPRSVNLQMNNGVTAVYLAGQAGTLDILQYLVLTANGSLKINSYDAMSVTQAAAQNGHLDCVKWLVKDQKCNANERDFDGSSALHFAATKGHHEVVDWLLREGGARVTLDNLGGSPLHNAAEMGHKQCISVLLKNGCDRRITDNKGLTAAELAEKCNHPECAALINSYVSTAKPIAAAAAAAVPSTSREAPQRYSQINGFQGQRPSYHRPPSVASTCSDFGYFPSRNNKSSQLLVHVDVHNYCKKDDDCVSQLSKETGEPECVFTSGQRSSVVTRRSNSPSQRPTSPPVSPTYSSRNRGSLGSELSSTASTLSSLSASASREFEESDDGHDARIPNLAAQRAPFLSARSKFESQSHIQYQGLSHGQSQSQGRPRVDTARSSGSCEESGEAIPSSKSWRYSQLYNSPKNVVLAEKGSKKMASPIQTSQNGGTKKTVIQISGSTVRIDDGTGSRDIKTHSHQNGKPARQGGSGQPKLIMTVTPSPSDPEVKASGSQVKATSVSASSGLTNGNVSPRNSTTSVQTSSNLNGGIPKMNGTSNIDSRPQSGSSVTSSINSAVKTGPSRVMNAHPPGFSALGDIMKSSLPTKVPPQDSPSPTVPQTKSSSPTPSPSPSEDKESESATVNRAPRVPAAPVQNGFVPPRYRSGPTDIISELQSGPGKSGLKQSKGFNKGTKMVFSFGGGNVAGPTPQSAQPSSDPALDAEFDPKKFVDQVPDTDSAGVPIPAWKKQMLAKGIAEKARKEAVERRKIEAEEARFKNVPAWKRALIEKKDSENKSVQNQTTTTTASVMQANNVDNGGRPLTWQEELRMKRAQVD